MTGLAYVNNSGHGNASWGVILLGVVVVLIVWGVRWLIRRNRRWAATARVMMGQMLALPCLGLADG